MKFPTGWSANSVILILVILSNVSSAQDTDHGGDFLITFFKSDFLRRLRHRRDLSEPFYHQMKWTHSAWLGQPSRSPRLFWTPNDDNVDFRVEANTIGGIVIGFNNEDFIVLWVDDATGIAHVEVQFAFNCV
ncbi:hypothetical protein RUM43_003728 [Polyplax serrata]|uniref:Uncharacterized protein n=1 Tax=Polyplax serrata TaxID=468196 RepID=A0AAN8PPQ9_POLSC